MHLNNVGGSADGGSVDTVDHGGRVVGLPVGEDPSVGTLEDDGQAPPDVAEGLVLGLTRLPGEGGGQAPHHVPRHLPPYSINIYHLL